MPRKSDNFWTDDRVKDLRSKYKTMTCREIADAWGCRTHRVTTKMRYMKLECLPDHDIQKRYIEQRAERDAETPKYDKVEWPAWARFEDVVPSKADGRGPQPKRCEVTSGSSSALAW